MVFIMKIAEHNSIYSNIINYLAQAHIKPHINLEMSNDLPFAILTILILLHTDQPLECGNHFCLGN
jgi:hypothetical protein